MIKAEEDWKKSVYEKAKIIEDSISKKLSKRKKGISRPKSLMYTQRSNHWIIDTRPNPSIFSHG